MRKFYNIVEDNKAPNVQSLWLHNGSLSYFGSNGWETVGGAASLEELGNKVDSLNNEINSIASDIDNIHATLENISSGGSYTEITWQELKNLRDNSQLSAGSLYRITDYQCTTILENTRSAGNQFDIIVLALTNNTLSEQAWAALHEGDTYFANSDLSAWKLWYCLDNDTTRFAWADNTSGNGRGVIYRMIDEFNNEVPYDFKNIMFYRKYDSSTSLWSIVPTTNSSNSVACYTFSSLGTSTSTSFTDTSLSRSNKIDNNIIKPYYSGRSQTLNNNIFFGTNIYINLINYYSHKNTFSEYCYKNIIGKYCYYNIFGNNCFYNILNEDCNNNTFGHSSRGNYLAIYCQNNQLGIHCYFNTFDSYSNYNKIGNYCKYNTFGTESNNIIFAANSEGTNLSNYFSYNTFESGVSYCVLYPTSASTKEVKYYHIKSSVVGDSSHKRTIEVTRNLSYVTTVALNSSGELKKWCEADLVG